MKRQPPMLHKLNTTLQALFVMCVVLLGAAQVAEAARIKDLAKIKGVRPNQVIGYGLVIGLDGTGDSRMQFTEQSLANMLSQLGIRVDPLKLRTRNVAAVMVTAELPPFSHTGDRMDVDVSSLGDARSLSGGTLLLTALTGGDGQVYATAQGALSSVGVGASAAGDTTQKGFLNAGRIVNGAIIEREMPNDFANRERITLSLKDADFTTASRTATAINLALGSEVARVSDGRTIEVNVPPAYKGRAADFIAAIERIDVTPDRAARVVINIREGTVVIGQEVTVSTVAISQGTLSIEIREQVDIEQPYPFSLGTTTAERNTEIEITEEGGELTVLPGGVSIGELAQALNAMGVSPRDMASIFQALKGAGALNADIIIQ